jgi:hypothetical protein
MPTKNLAKYLHTLLGTYVVGAVLATAVGALFGLGVGLILAAFMATVAAVNVFTMTPCVDGGTRHRYVFTSLRGCECRVCHDVQHVDELGWVPRDTDWNGHAEY